jgi:hypothetical protein
MLSSAIALLIFYALYTAIDVHLRFADAGREAIQEATLTRSLAARINSDLMSCLGMPDPGRYRNESAGSSTSGTTGGATTGTTTPTTTGTGTTGSATTGTATAGATTAGTGATDMEASQMPDGISNLNAIIGDEMTLQVFVSKVPSYQNLSSQAETGQAATGQVGVGQAATGQNQDPAMTQPPGSDQRVILYWMATGADGTGLARQEVTVSTPPGGGGQSPLAMGTSQEADYIIAPEIDTVTFSYFDGTSWQSSWDSRTLASDGKTPVGPPNAIAVEFTFKDPGDGSTLNRRASYRHVIAIPTANGLPLTDPDAELNLEP